MAQRPVDTMLRCLSTHEQVVGDHTFPRLYHFKKRRLPRNSLASIQDRFCNSSVVEGADLPTTLPDYSEIQFQNKVTNHHDVVEKRESLLKEYNRLARKHGIRQLNNFPRRQSSIPVGICLYLSALATTMLLFHNKTPYTLGSLYFNIRKLMRLNTVLITETL